MENDIGFGGILVRCLSYIALWLIAATVFALLWYGFDLFQGHVWRMADYWRWSMVQWSTLAILGPIALWSAARNPIEPPHRLRRFAIHLLASIGFTILAVFAGTWLSLLVEPGSPQIREQLGQFVTKHAEAGFLAYWVLVMVSQATHFYREKNRRELQATRLQAQLAQSRLQVLKMQLHPHFLFNTLHAAATLVREDAAAAEDMLLRLADLLRAYLDDDRQEIALADELELVDLYLGIQRVRFKDRLTTRVEAAPDIRGCAVPNLILQPIVENAIQHGIGKHVGEDCVQVDCYRSGESLCMDVINRNSLFSALSTESSGNGIGLSNSRMRLRELYADDAQIRIDPLSPRGAICRIRLPFRLLNVAPVGRSGNAA